MRDFILKEVVFIEEQYLELKTSDCALKNG